MIDVADLVSTKISMCFFNWENNVNTYSETSILQKANARIAQMEEQPGIQ